MKKLTWNLPGFSLELDSLFDKSSGPSWKDVTADFFEKAHQSLRQKFSSKAVGFYDWPIQRDASELQRMKELAKRLREQFDCALVIGIGGSHLGGAALLQALRPPDQVEAFPIFWLNQVDSSSVESIRHQLKKRKPATLVISKSGNTNETLAGFFHFSPSLDPKGYVIITDPQGGSLGSLAEKFHWERFKIPPNIGGRYSVLTAVGLLPALVAALEVDEILGGAAQMRQVLERLAPIENPAYWLCFAKFAWDTRFRHSIQYLMPYQSNLALFADWYVQLWAESLGKQKTKTPATAAGFTPVAALGTRDQHSLLQLFREGPADKLIGFVDVIGKTKITTIGRPPFEISGTSPLPNQSFEKLNHLALKATQMSLDRGGIPTYRIELPGVTPEAMGALLFFFQTACAFGGELYGVDAFNQPGVEEAKHLWAESL